MNGPFLAKHHTVENRKKALAFVATQIPELKTLNESTVVLEPFGTCRFATYTHAKGAMVSSEEHPEFGTADWHSNDNLMLFREVGDGRAFLYICRINSLFDKRTIGRHGVKWEDVRRLARRVFVFEL